MKLVLPTRRAVERLSPYQAPVEGRAGKLRLDFNENTTGCSPGVQRALRQMSRELIAMYPEYEAATRELARFFHVRPAEMLLTNGADDGLRLLFDTFIEPGSSVLLVEPTFTMYRFYADVAGARVLGLRYDRRMRFPLRDVVRALRSHGRGPTRPPRLFFLANPNNPTGTLVSKSELARILRAARRTVVVVDEAYFEFSGLTVLPWIRRHRNLVVTRTFSKAAGLAGLRLGCVFSNRPVMDALRKVASPFPVNAPALVAARAALRDKPFIRRYIKEVNASRQVVQVALNRLGARTFPSAANFVLADFGPRVPRLLRDLERHGILLRDRTPDFERPGFVRITVGTLQQTQRLIRAIEKLW